MEEVRLIFKRSCTLEYNILLHIEMKLNINDIHIR